MHIGYLTTLNLETNHTNTHCILVGISIKCDFVHILCFMAENVLGVIVMS